MIPGRMDNRVFIKTVPVAPLQSAQERLFFVCCDTITDMLSTFL
ncbi:hypothetical protein Xszus_00490 [Xenorhabdus szentirmaii]|nr:hypothetical protein Xsze_03616 [Xenorhabdus szentirmaii DSM 16338]PHM40815.1 hypothetical protein Xszus_00490 [Xenorhabdus szentirmaii]